LVLQDDGIDRRLAVDPSVVPLVEGCGTNQAVFRRSDGSWGCGALEVIDPQELAELRQSNAAAMEQDTQQTSLLDELRDAPFGHSAIACAVDEASARNGNAFRLHGRIVHAGASPNQQVLVFCPVSPGHPRPRWDTLTMLYRDPDGAGPAQVTLALRFTEPIGDQTLTQTVEGAELDSQLGPVLIGDQVAELSVSFSHDFDVHRRYYYLQSSLVHASTVASTALVGFRLWRQR
jgi:hypothetical protein